MCSYAELRIRCCLSENKIERESEYNKDGRKLKMGATFIKITHFHSREKENDYTEHTITVAWKEPALVTHDWERLIGAVNHALTSIRIAPTHKTVFLII